MDQIKIIQVSTAGQINAVASLAKEIWAEHYIPIVGEAQVDYMLEAFQSPEAIARQIAEEKFSYYLLQEDVYIGYIGVAPGQSIDGLFLSKLYIRAGERGKGRGKAAVRFVEKLAKQMNLKHITLRVNKHNTNSIAAYEKLGFKKIQSLITDVGGGFFMDDYVMQKSAGKCIGKTIQRR